MLAIGDVAAVAVDDDGSVADHGVEIAPGREPPLRQGFVVQPDGADRLPGSGGPGRRLQAIADIGEVACRLERGHHE